MKLIKLNGIDCYLLNKEPNWGNNIKVKLNIPRENEIGLTGIETRRKLNESIRFSVSYSTIYEGAELTELQNSLKNLTTEIVLCPLWFALTPSNETKITTNYYYKSEGNVLISIDELDNYECWVYPVLFGRLEKTPSVSLMTDELGEITFDFIENSDEHFAIMPEYQKLNYQGWELFKFSPDWSTYETAKPDVQVLRTQIGQKREQATEYFGDRVKQRISFNVNLVKDNILEFIKFFQDNIDVAFWNKTGIAPFRLTGNISKDDTRIKISSDVDITKNKFILISDLEKQEIVQATEVEYDETEQSYFINLASPVNNSFNLGDTRLEFVILSRFNSDTIEIDFSDIYLASSKVETIQSEYEAEYVGNEIPRETIGGLGAVAYLYKFIIQYPDTTNQWLVTGYEKDLIYNNETYRSEQIEHNDIVSELNLNRNSLTITTEYSNNLPFSQLLPLTIEFPVKVEIYEVEVENYVVQTINKCFSGEIVNVRYDGSIISAEAKSITGLFEHKTPRRLLQTSCNWLIYEPSCGLDFDFWTWQGVVNTYNPDTLEILIANINPKNISQTKPITQHFFAGGLIAHGVGSSREFRTIIDNEAIVDGKMVLYVSSGFNNPINEGDYLDFSAGCDGQYLTCKDKFNNLSNFGGFPFMPLSNPSMLKVSQNVSSGGKK